MIQLRWHGVWFPIATVRIVHGRFRSSVRVPAPLFHGMLRLRAVVPSVGPSRAVHVRVR